MQAEPIELVDFETLAGQSRARLIAAISGTVALACASSDSKPKC